MRFRETDAVVRLHLILWAVDLDAGLQKCRPLMVKIGAQQIEAGLANTGTEGQFSVTLLASSPSFDGESGEQTLRRVTLSLLTALGLGEEYFELSEVDGQLITRAFAMGPRELVDVLAVVSVFGVDVVDSWVQLDAGITINVARTPCPSRRCIALHLPAGGP